MKRSVLVLSLLVSTSSGCQITLPLEAAVRTDHHASREDVLPLELRAEGLLRLSTSYGRVELVASAGPCELRATLSAGGRTDEEARAVLARYEVRVERGEEGLEAKLVGQPLSIHEGGARLELSANVDFVATVPEGTRIAATSGSGDLVTRGALGALTLETGYGAIAIDSARGEVRAKSGSGDVRAVRLEGGPAELESGYGSIEVHAARVERLTCTSGSGDVSVDEGEARELELATDYGSIRVRRALGSVRARSGSGHVHLAGVEGTVEAKSDYGSVEIEGVLRALTATSGSGSVTVRAAEGSRVESDWRLDSSYGAVVLRAPAAFACTLDARTDYGEVDCDFPVTLEAGKKKGDHRLRGAIGGGGGRVTLTSGSGDVALKKL